MIRKEVEENLYQLLVEFMTAINQKNMNLLAKKFALDEPVFDEIVENLEEYFGRDFMIEPPPFGRAFEPLRGKRLSLSIYEMNDPGVFGVEAVIWRQGQPQEPIIHAQASGDAGHLQFEFKYIGS